MSYNGFPNWDTWNANLWMTDSAWKRTQINDAIRDGLTEPNDLAEYLRGSIVDFIPLHETPYEGELVFGDRLNPDAVDWITLAENYIMKWSDHEDD